MEKPSSEDAERCLDIRRKSRRGEYVSEKDRSWNRKMFNCFEEWYSKTEARVFNDTVPFGSNVKIEEPEID